MMRKMRFIAVLMLLVSGCTKPRSGGDQALRGAFVGGIVQDNVDGGAGVSLRGHITWHGSVRSAPDDEQRTGISLRGNLR